MDQPWTPAPCFVSVINCRVKLPTYFRPRVHPSWLRVLTLCLGSETDCPYFDPGWPHHPQEMSRPSVRGPGVSPETPRPVQYSLGSAGRRWGGPGWVQQVPCVWTVHSPGHCLLTSLSRFLGQPQQNSPQALESHFLQVKSCTTNEKES